MIRNLKILIFIFILVLSSISEAVVKVQDFRGKEIILKKPAERVVCLIESALTGIYMLQQQNKVVGIPTNVYEEGYYYSETFKYYAYLDERIRNKSLPAVGNWEKVNIEKVLSLNPDLIIIWSSQTDAISTFEKLGIPVYGVFITRLEDVYKETLDFGKLLDAEKRAKELVEYVQREVKYFKNKSSKISNKRKVYFSWAQLNFLQTSCKGSIVDELISLVGATNICSNIKGESVTLNMEKLILLNPDVILMWHSKSLSPLNLKSNNQLQTVSAIKKNLIFQFPDTFSFDLWTLKFLYATKFMAKNIYPDIYNYDLNKEYQKIMNFLYGKSFSFN
ncbi:MAG: ABC transporter substrate-binding protein [Thermodesulfovibrio sp.]|nr:ABC transporter substrate-binding protein [Thermodesulfovibrio sp.]